MGGLSQIRLRIHGNGAAGKIATEIGRRGERR